MTDIGKEKAHNKKYTEKKSSFDWKNKMDMTLNK